MSDTPRIGTPPIDAARRRLPDTPFYVEFELSPDTWVRSLHHAAQKGFETRDAAERFIDVFGGAAKYRVRERA